MKNFINEIKNDPKKFLIKNAGNIAVILISIITFIIGIYAVNFLVSFLLVGGLNILLFGIPFIQNIVEKKSGKTIRIKTRYEEPKGGNNMSKTKVFKEKPKKEKKEKPVKEKKPKKKRSGWWTFFKILLILFFLGVIAVTIAVVLFFAMIIREAPEFDPNNLYKQESTIIYDVDGKIITKLGVKKREKISYDDLPEVLINAIVATEDSKFFQHKGVDLQRFIVASVKQVLKMPGAGGASTLTMQISKNAFTSKEDSGWEGIKRKFTDIYVSMFQIEKKYSKKEIMEFYVNSYYLGSGAYGVEQASQTYFGKSAKELTLPEAAIIAGLFQSPGKNSPITNPESAKKRMETVLYLMERHGYITKEEQKAAASVEISDLLAQANNNAEKNYYLDFIDTVVEEVKNDTGNNPYTTPMKIYTTMNRSLQKKVDDIMSGKTFDWENSVVQAGISIIDPKTGAIAAIGAGRNRTGESVYNHATMIDRQIGSTAKPLYDYAPSIEYKGASSYTPYFDEEYSYSDGTEINNWDGGYFGWQTSRQALAGSRNIPALKAFQTVPRTKLQTFVKNLGLDPEIENGFLHEAHAIGGYNGENPLSMSSAYGTFFNGGVRVTPHSYTKIIYRDTDETYEKVIKETKVMSDATAFITYDMLLSTTPEALGYYGNLNNGVKFAAKTGTSNFTDATKQAHGLAQDAINDLWVVGGTDQYSIAVWYGYDKIDKANYTHFGSNQHSRLFNTVANAALTKASGIKVPSSVVQVSVENYNATPLLPSAYTPSEFKISEYFVKGTEPTETSTRYAQLANVKNLTGEVSGNQVKLSWSAISTPDGINKKKMQETYKSMFRSTDQMNGFIDMLVNILGKLTYEVYEKQSDGTLRLIGSTSETTYTFDITSTSSASTFIVKSSYSRYKAPTSTGTTVTVDTSGVEIKPTFKLLGSSKETVAVNSDPATFYSTKGPAVYDNLINVTNQASITKTVTNSSDKEVNNLTFISTPGTYTIKYTITYDSYTETLEQTVVVK